MQRRAAVQASRDPPDLRSIPESHLAGARPVRHRGSLLQQLRRGRPAEALSGNGEASTAMTAPAPILEPAAYSHVFDRWRGATIMQFWGPGNVGDLLIRHGAEQLFAAY